MSTLSLNLLSFISIFPDDVATIKSYFSRACDMFEMDDYGKSNLTQCRLKIAEYAAKEGHYSEAIKIFESEARKCISNDLTKYKAKDYFWQAGVLHLVVGDLVTCKIALERYQSVGVVLNIWQWQQEQHQRHIYENMLIRCRVSHSSCIIHDQERRMLRRLLLTETILLQLSAFPLISRETSK